VVLAVTVDAADALLDVHRIPRQVEVKQHARELEIDPFASGRRADKNARTVLLTKPPLGRQLRAVVAAAQHNHALAGIGSLDFPSDQINSAKICREDDDLLFGILAPQCPQTIQKLLDLGFGRVGKRSQ
jgi:hypothetical protein